jgi:CRISPR system Cascade subunit CasC
MIKRTIVEVHALQNVPPSNLNRDDTGAPKSAVYGGVLRARVSSQAWKKATRKHFTESLEPSEVGVRTKRVAEVLAERITALDKTIDGPDALAAASAVIGAATGAKLKPPQRKAERAKKAGEPEPAPEASYLLFLSARQLDGLAELAVKAWPEIDAFFKDKANQTLAKATANTRHSVDIALFGRMVADSTDVNVDAAVQVAHALSVHRVENESDYYTAVDDRNTTDSEAGAGMIGSIDFNSATLYRFAAVDVNLLAKNLGMGLDEEKEPSVAVRKAVEAFVDGFIASLPTGKINTFGNHTLPDAVIVKVRSDRPISLVSAFEEPITADQVGGHMRGACDKLAAFSREVDERYGQDDTLTWTLRVGGATGAIEGLGTPALRLSELVTKVGAAVTERLERHE